MKKKFFKLSLVLSCMMMGNMYSQVGMPTNNPNKDAVLDLNRTDGTSAKGLLLPNVALTGISSFAPMTAHVAGMHVWNTATAGSGVNAVTPGEYFNDGTKWVRIASTANAWIQDGNNNGALKAIGTNDNFDFPIETNGTEKMRVTSGGQLLINTNTPLTGGATAKIQIDNGTTVGAIQIKDGTQGIDKILTSDSNGVGRWVAPVTAETFIAIQGVNVSLPYDNWTYSKRSLNLTKGVWIITLTDRTTAWTSSTPSNLVTGELVAGWSSSASSFTPSTFFNNGGHSCVSSQMVPAAPNNYLNWNYTFVVTITNISETIYLWFQSKSNAVTSVPIIYNGAGGLFSTAYGALIAQKVSQ